MNHQLTTIAALALIALPVSACGSHTAQVPASASVPDQSANRVYESELVSAALAATKNRVYESDLVDAALAARRTRP